MTLKKIIISSIILSAVFFFIGWVLTPAVMHFVITHMKSVSTNVEIINTSIKAQFRIHLLSSISLAIIPLMVLAASIIIIQVRKKYITTWDYFFYLSILVVVYFVASVFKFYALEATIVKILNIPVSADIKNTLPLDQVLLYNWAFYASLVAFIFIIFFAKRKRKSD